MVTKRKLEWMSVDTVGPTSDEMGNSPWYPGTNGCPIIGSENMLAQRRTDRQTVRQTDRRTDKRQNASIEKSSQSSKNLIMPND